MKATEVLRHEHEVVMLVLNGTRRVVGNLAGALQADPLLAEKLHGFFANFVDHCHHTKEERHLFPRLWQRGLPRGHGPTALMLKEHELGREIVRDIGDVLPGVAKGDAEAISKLRQALLDYDGLMREHIDKENRVLFMLAEDLLTDADNEELVAAFEQVETQEIGEGMHEKYHQLAHELAGQ